jgi:hypothetical protein
MSISSQEEYNESESEEDHIVEAFTRKYIGKLACY